jgi:hypothetical protein
MNRRHERRRRGYPADAGCAHDRPHIEPGRLLRSVPVELAREAQARLDAWRATRPPPPTHCPRCGLTLADGAGAGRVCEPSPVGATHFYCEVD